MRSSKLVRPEVLKSAVCILVVLIALFGFSSMIMADETSADPAKEKWQDKKEEMQQKFEDKKHFWQGKKDELTFEEDYGVGDGHQEGKPGTRVGHSDNMPGKRLGHRKGQTGSDESSPDGNFEPNRNPGFRNRANQGENFMPRRRRMFDKDNNPPGMRGGEGTNWENLPGRRGGPGTSPDKSGKGFFKGNSENNGNNGSNGLHIGNRKNGVGKGIKNYTGRTKANKGKKGN